MKRRLVKELNNLINEKVLIEGWIYKIRSLKSITFLILRDRSGLVQCVVDNDKFNINDITIESVASIVGKVKEGKNSLNPFEIEVQSIDVINEAKESLPIEINKEELEVNLDTMLNKRVLSVRHKKVNAIFKIQNIMQFNMINSLNKFCYKYFLIFKIIKSIKIYNYILMLSPLLHSYFSMNSLSAVV